MRKGSDRQKADGSIAQQEKLLGEQVTRIEQLNEQVDEQMVKIQKTHKMGATKHCKGAPGVTLQL